jgi:ATP-dependent Clp protease ATP-binding subunit ClpC
MLERFSERARRVIVLATEEARRRGHAAVGPEHLLAGLLRDGEGMGVRLLDQAGVTRAALLAQAERALDALPAPGGPVALSEAVKRVLEQSLALDERHWRRHVGTEHLAIALLGGDERETVLAILRDAGADVARVRHLAGLCRRLGRRPSDDAVALIATSPWRLRI